MDGQFGGAAFYKADEYCTLLPLGAKCFFDAQCRGESRVSANKGEEHGGLYCDKQGGTNGRCKHHGSSITCPLSPAERYVCGTITSPCGSEQYACGKETYVKRVLALPDLPYLPYLPSLRSNGSLSAQPYLYSLRSSLPLSQSLARVQLMPYMFVRHASSASCIMCVLLATSHEPTMCFDCKGMGAGGEDSANHEPSSAREKRRAQPPSTAPGQYHAVPCLPRRGVELAHF